MNFDLLLKACETEDWRLASSLLYKQWSSHFLSAFVFKKNLDDDERPWESEFDEKRLGKCIFLGGFAKYGLSIKSLNKRYC